MIRRSAIAGGALLWTTPVVQSLGNDSAYAWFRGSQKPGACRCNVHVLTIAPTECHPDLGSNNRLLPSGKSVSFQVQTSTGCGGAQLQCAPMGEDIVWTEVSAAGCSMVAQNGDTCLVHVTAYPATITLQVTSSLTCAGTQGSATSCSDTRIRRFCFSQVTGAQSQRCGRFPSHDNRLHGTEHCA